jgi:hypothetical protein
VQASEWEDVKNRTERVGIAGASTRGTNSTSCSEEKNSTCAGVRPVTFGESINLAIGPNRFDFFWYFSRQFGLVLSRQAQRTLTKHTRAAQLKHLGEVTLVFVLYVNR